MPHPRVLIPTLRSGLCVVALLVGCDAPEAPTPVGSLEPEVVSNHFVGSATCIGCHATEGAGWSGSDHDRAMEVASSSSVIGRFDGDSLRRSNETWRFLREGDDYIVELEQPDLPIDRMRVAYTFGIDPLQQFLVERSGGRFQALPIAWDARSAEVGGQRWIDLQPGEEISADDPLHWEALAYNWNSQCAACHSTSLSKGYDESTGVFASRWAELDVGCEACHGPGSGHVAIHDPSIDAPQGTAGLDVAFDPWRPDAWRRPSGARIASRVEARTHDTQIEVCAPCHSRRTQIVDVPTIGAPYLDGHRPALLDPELYFEDGQIRDEVYVWGSFLQSRMHGAGVRCNDCHDPHSLGLRREGNALCTGCHDPGSYDLTAHHGHSPDTKGSACVDCHMPERVYMEVDARRDHSFPIPRPERSQTLGVPNACSECHSERDASWAASAIVDWREEGGVAPAHWSDHLVDAGAVRTDPNRWIEIATEPGFTSIVRANAWSRFSREAQASEAASHAEILRDVSRTGTELEKLAIVDVARALAPELRASVLRPLLEDDRLAIRVSAAEALADSPPEALRAADRAILGRALREHRARLLANAERPDAQVGLGTLAVLYGEPEAARDAYRRAISIAPYFVPAYVNLADLERMLGRDTEAVELLRRAVELTPDDALVLHAFGLALYRSGDEGSGLTELARAAAIAPDQPRLVLAWALALDASARREEAIDVLSGALDRGTQSPDLRYALVTILRDRGELDRARARAEAWRNADPADARPRALLRELGAERDGPVSAYPRPD